MRLQPLQRLAQRWSAQSSSCRAMMSSGPTVFDKIVTITVTDAKGKRYTIRGREGQTLVNLLAEHEVLGNADTVGLSPLGAGIMEAHITIPSDFLEQVPPLTQFDRRTLAEIAPSTSSHSYLASKVVLSKALQGMNFSVGKLQPWRTL